LAALAQPFVPQTSAKISRALNGSETSRPWPKAIADTLAQLTPGAAIGVPDVLFAKIEDTQVAEWAGRFGGIGP
jgi:methionyl-tRNA synthetase